MARRLQEGTLTSMDAAKEKDSGDRDEDEVQLMDTGASMNVVGVDLVRRYGLQIHPTSGSLRGTDGYRYEVLGVTQMKVEITGLKKEPGISSSSSETS